jgi:hypothetical protein
MDDLFIKSHLLQLDEEEEEEKEELKEEAEETEEEEEFCSPDGDEPEEL